MWGNVVQSHHCFSIMISTTALFYHYIWLGKLEESIVWPWCSEAVVIGTHQLGHSKGPAHYRDLLLFSLGCAHQGRGPRYQYVLSMKPALTSIVADTGHSTSCGKTLNWTQLASSISSPTLAPYSRFPPLLLSPVLPFSLMCSLSCKAIQLLTNSFLLLFALNWWFRISCAEPYVMGFKIIY